MEQYMDNFWLALGLTVFAGLSTGVGSALAFFTRSTNKSFLSLALGFSAGVMLYVSFIDIFPKAEEELIMAHGETWGSWLTVISFFGGMAFIAIIDKLVPSAENPHENMKVEDLEDEDERKEYEGRKALMRTGLFTAIAIAIHNFPEGLATFTAMMTDPTLGIPIAIAIAIHNIPEGIAVSVPIYFATNSRKKAFMYSFLSGLSEPVGALIGFFLLYSFFNETIFGVLFSAVGGIMVYISLDELLPAAKEYGKHHLSIYGLMAGMVVMALSVLLLM